MAKKQQLAILQKGNIPEIGLYEGLPEGMKVTGVTYLKSGNDIKLSWIKTAVDHDYEAGERLEHLNEILEKITPIKPYPEHQKHKDYITDATTIYPLSDIHVGMRAWIGNNDSSFDLKIFADMYDHAIDYLVYNAKPTETATFILAGDILHWSGSTAVTERSGHVLDADGRTPMIIDACLRWAFRSIECILQRHKTVNIVVIPGNHDETSAMMLRKTIKYTMQNNSRVNVIDDDHVMQCITFGNSAIFATHGHVVRYKNVKDFIYSHFRGIVGRSEHLTCFIGHLHHIIDNDQGGIRVKQMATLTPPDNYGMGFALSDREVSSYTVSAEHGIIAQNTFKSTMYKKGE